MTTLIATRSELLARRSQEAIARRGHTLLTQKRAALIAELRRLAVELNVRRLTAEVTRTTRQVNALEQVVIPRIAVQRRYIAATLEQRALKDRVRVTRRRVRAP
jgi:vacuolar-type H+-ATPase subunit D/Vma8